MTLPWIHAAPKTCIKKLVRHVYSYMISNVHPDTEFCIYSFVNTKLYAQIATFILELEFFFFFSEQKHGSQQSLGLNKNFCKRLNLSNKLTVKRIMSGSLPAQRPQLRKRSLYFSGNPETVSRCKARTWPPPAGGC